MFLKDAQSVPFEQKLLMVDKYGLPETKNMCFNSPEFQNHVFVQELMEKSEYKGIGDKLKIELLEKSFNSLKINYYYY